MSQSKYEVLCKVVDDVEAIKTNFTTQFTDGFSTFMGCPKDHISFKVGELVFQPDLVSFKVDLIFKISSKEHSRKVCVEGLLVEFHPKFDLGKQYLIPGRGDYGLLNDRFFSSILEDIEKSIS